MTRPQLRLDPAKRLPLLKSHLSQPPAPEPVLPVGKSHTHPSKPSSGTENAAVYFIGNATILIEYSGIRILTDPNFLHAGDHVHLGPGVATERLKNPAVELDALPSLDVILLSHYHDDHFDRLVEDALNRKFPIITTPHAKECLASEPEPFTNVFAMPGKHVPPGVLSTVSDILGAVPPTNGWMVELGDPVGYRIYISVDTLFVDELEEIPRWLRGEKVDLMLVHLGGTTIPSPKMPLLMVTMDAAMGVKLMRLVEPEVTVPVHFDDYSVMVSGLEEFVKEVEKEGLGGKVVCLRRGEEYRFEVRG
ncbi:hypothetical protein OQA88_9526 [Cercophora sp. LCS_1]